MQKYLNSIMLLLGLLAASAVTTITVYYGFASSYQWIIKESSSISDSAYHLLIAKAFWQNKVYDVYDFSNQLTVMKEALGDHINSTMTISVLPTALIVWLPFVFLPSISLVYSAWIGFSLSMFAYAAINFSSKAHYLNSKTTSILLAAITFIAFSSSMHNAIGLGQTSILQIACLLLIETNCINKKDNNTTRLTNVILLFLASIKPQFFFLGAGILLINRRYTDAILAGLFIALCCILLTPKLGYLWPSHYISTLLIFKDGSTPNGYFGFVPSKMNVFRSAFDNYLGTKTSSLITWIFLITTYLSTIIISLLQNSSQKNRAQKNITQTFYKQVMLSGYLLFAPHSGFYEEILMATILCGFISDRNSSSLLQKYRYMWLIALIMLVNRDLFLPLEGFVMFWWFFKFIFLLATCAMFIPSLIHFCKKMNENSWASEILAKPS